MAYSETTTPSQLYTFTYPSYKGAFSIHSEQPVLPMSTPNPRMMAELRKLHQKHARAVARTARMIEKLANRLVRLQRETVREAKAIAGNKYEVDHAVGFDAHSPIDKKNTKYEPDTGPTFVDIMNTARATANYAERVAEATPPLPLPSE